MLKSSPLSSLASLSAHVDHAEVDTVRREVDLVDLSGPLAGLQNVLSRRDVVDAADPLGGAEKIAGPKIFQEFGQANGREIPLWFKS